MEIPSQYGKQPNRWWVVVAQCVACNSVVSTQHSFFTCATACVPWWVWPGGSHSSCSHPCGGFPALAGASCCQVVEQLSMHKFLVTLSSELYHTLPAYWYVGTPPSDHAAPSLTCTQRPLHGPGPLLQRAARSQLLGCHVSHGQYPLPNLLLPHHLGSKNGLSLRVGPGMTFST